jgi:hypothetical protein
MPWLENRSPAASSINSNVSFTRNKEPSFFPRSRNPA